VDKTKHKNNPKILKTSSNMVKKQEVHKSVANLVAERYLAKI